MTTYRVHYPLISRDAHRDFADKAEANRFFYEMRNRTSPYLTMHSWRHVRMVAIYDEPAEPADTDIDPVTGLTFAEGRARAQALREGRFANAAHEFDALRPGRFSRL